MGMSCPKIDFSGLSLDGGPGSGARWESVRAQVMDALLGHGFFEVASDKLSREVWDEVFGGPMEEAFSVPGENKKSTSNGRRYSNYVSGETFEILMVEDPTDPASVDAYTHLLRPQGIPSFSKMVVETSKALGELDVMVRKMIFQGLHIENHFGSHLESTKLRLRMVRYDAKDNIGSPAGMGEHSDMNVLSIVYQHRSDGLEVQSVDDQWHRVPPYTCLVIIGDVLTAFTNGRLKRTVHRVRVAEKETCRYSVGFNSRLVEGYKLEAPEELVDGEHPRLYKTLEIESYMNHYFAKVMGTSADPLKTYPGVDGAETTF